MLTKPLHHSQQLVKKVANAIIVRLHVQLNFELEREILGFGDCIKVLQPEKLKRRIRQKMENAAALYQHELKPTDVASAMKRIHRRGFALLNTLYTKQEADTMLFMISRAQQADQWHETHQLLESMPRLERIIFNQNLTLLMEEGFGPSYTIASASYLEKPETSGSWLQHAEMAEDLPTARERQPDFIVYIYLDQTDTTDRTIQVIPRTCKNKLTSEQIDEISATTEPAQCEVRKGGIMIVRPFTLYRYASGCACSRMIRLVFGQH